MKKCNTCNVEKELSAYHKWSRSPDGHYNKCKVCRSFYDAKHYQGSASRRLAISSANKKSVGERRRQYHEYKATLSCTDCNNNNPIVLEFDHLKDKTINISAMIKQGYTWNRILEEIAKCEVVCANCHRIRTHNRRSKP